MWEMIESGSSLLMAPEDRQPFCPLQSADVPYIIILKEDRTFQTQRQLAFLHKKRIWKNQSVVFEVRERAC
jgi:hypothetical protein